MAAVRPLKARITNAVGTAPTRIDVFDDIGEGGWFAEGLTAKSFANQLSGVTGPLEVHINSGGGDVWDGIGIKNAIEAHSGPVTTVVDGIAASIASVIAQAGSERVMMPGSMMMIHEASTVAAGNAADMAKTSEILNGVSANLSEIYARTAGGTAEDWRAAMKAETWYTAEQAVAAGLADRTGDGAAVLPFGLDAEVFAASAPLEIAAQLRTLPRTMHIENAGSGNQELLNVVREHIDVHDESTAAPKNPGGKKRKAKASKRIANKALPIHHTATVDEPWDGPAAVAAMPNDHAVLQYCHAWMSAEAAAETPREGDNDADDQKGSYKFPHHRTKGGPANLAACRNGLARLDSANIPDGDRAGVKAHLQAHLDDAKGGDDESTDSRAELPAWFTDEAAPLPAWLYDAEEAK